MVAPPRSSGGGASFSLLPRLRLPFWQCRLRAGCGMQMKRAKAAGQRRHFGNGEARRRINEINGINGMKGMDELPAAPSSGLALGQARARALALRRSGAAGAGAATWRGRVQGRQKEKDRWRTRR